MRTISWTVAGRGLAMLMFIFFALALPAAVQAQQDEDTFEHFTVTVTGQIPCDVIICHNAPGGGVCTVFAPGTTTVLRGGGPFVIVDRNGISHPINAKIGCLRSVLIAPSCCIDICYTTDRTGMPVLTVTVPQFPTCMD